MATVTFEHATRTYPKAERPAVADLDLRNGVTTMYVTHDQVEAMTMSDRVAVLNDGHLHQVDTPHFLFAKPANVFVAGFIGSPQMNLHEARLGEGGAVLAGYTVPLPRSTAEAAARDGSTVTLGFRAEWVDPRHVPEKGSQVRLTIRPDELHVFSAVSGERLL